jgi:hypothetical protein
MGNNKDNQLSTVLLLLFLGFLIYILMKPSDIHEQFSSVDCSNCKPSTTSISNINSDSNNDKTNISPEMLKQILADSDNTDSNSKKAIHNFNPSDNIDDNMGADLSDAFKDLNIPALTPDVVNTNKNNVKNYNAKDFLPKEINDKWFDTDFSQAKFNINDDKLINTERYIIGINTVGQSLKNASYDIRGTVPNPKFSVSPWNNSTYEADYNIKPLC